MIAWIETDVGLRGETVNSVFNICSVDGGLRMVHTNSDGEQLSPRYTYLGVDPSPLKVMAALKEDRLVKRRAADR